MTEHSDRPSPRVAFHVGYPKCASTTLQRALFQPHPEINSIGKPLHRTNPQIDHMIKSIRFRDRFQQAGDPGLHSLFDGLLDADRVNVMSVEDFSFGPFWTTDIHKTVDRSGIAQTLHALAPEALIIVVLREQAAILKSIYAQLATGVKLPAFPTWVDRQFDTLGEGSVLDALRYKDFLDGYADLFGPGRVVPLDLAEISADQTAAFARLTQALGIAALAETTPEKHNARRSKLETALRRAWKKADPCKGRPISCPALCATP